jgi:hypothetical protein
MPNQTRMENGVIVELTDQEQAEYDARQVAWQAGAANRALLAQIVTLEATITARRRDEAILGEDNGWLAGVRSQIAALRTQLT